MAEPAGKRNQAFDVRLLSHHPAGKACLAVCLANGWTPSSGDVVRLVRLWDAVRQGRISEAALSTRRLEFARWLLHSGRLNEGLSDLAAHDPLSGC